MPGNITALQLLARWALPMQLFVFFKKCQFAFASLLGTPLGFWRTEIFGVLDGMLIDGVGGG